MAFKICQNSFLPITPPRTLLDQVRTLTQTAQSAEEETPLPICYPTQHQSTFGPRHGPPRNPAISTPMCMLIFHSVVYVLFYLMINIFDLHLTKLTFAGCSHPLIIVSSKDSESDDHDDTKINISKSWYLLMLCKSSYMTHLCNE